MLDLLPQWQDTHIEQVKVGKGHRYKVSGIEGTLTSVTTLTGVVDKSGGLTYWARNDSTERMAQALLAVGYEAMREMPRSDWEKAIQTAQAHGAAENTEGRDLGTLTHQLLHAALISDEDAQRLEEPIVDADWSAEEQQKVLPAVQSALGAIKRLELQMVDQERALWHPLFFYAGTIDWMGWDPYGWLHILDWKRSKKHYPEQDYQVAAYMEMVKALTGIQNLKGHVCILSREDGAPADIHDVDYPDEAFEVFLACQNLDVNIKNYEKLGRRK